MDTKVNYLINYSPLLFVTPLKPFVLTKKHLQLNWLEMDYNLYKQNFLWKNLFHKNSLTDKLGLRQYRLNPEYNFFNRVYTFNFHSIINFIFNNNYSNISNPPSFLKVNFNFFSDFVFNSFDILLTAILTI